jgi:hypothetical protein
VVADNEHFARLYARVNFCPQAGARIDRTQFFQEVLIEPYSYRCSTGTGSIKLPQKLPVEENIEYVGTEALNRLIMQTIESLSKV